jgi:hypothetical protein
MWPLQPQSRLQGVVRLLRAKLEDQMRDRLKAGKQPQPDAGHGFLKTTAAWQDRFFPTPPASSLDYFLKHLP